MQIERIQNRDGLTKEEAISRIDAQMSLEEKAKRADVVIDSSNAPEVTLQLVEKYGMRDYYKGLIIHV